MGDTGLTTREGSRAQASVRPGVPAPPRRETERRDGTQGLPVAHKETTQEQLIETAHETTQYDSHGSSLFSMRVSENHRQTRHTQHFCQFGSAVTLDSTMSGG